MSWICCQLGARDHYLVPRSLHRIGRLAGLITEAWVPPNSLLSGLLPEKLDERIQQRYDAALSNARVAHSTISFIGREARARFPASKNLWDPIIARNDWFQAKATRHLTMLLAEDPGADHVVFAYSYAAREVLKTARERGCITVLGQIDPGPPEERIVNELYRRHGKEQPSWERVPDAYWEAWREECEVSHKIAVNSEWSRSALIGEGVPSEKIHVVPLAYDPPLEALRNRRIYPTKFNAARPLRVLFLGSLIPRKGIHEMLEATALMRDAPVEFIFVGTPGIEPHRSLIDNPRVHWMGPVPRDRVHAFYKSADVFILPTHSDGFGLTQLEAMAWGLPVIATNNCGDVVTHEINGIVLATVDSKAIAQAVNWFLGSPDRLQSMSVCAIQTSREFCSQKLALRLLECL